MQKGALAPRKCERNKWIVSAVWWREGERAGGKVGGRQRWKEGGIERGTARESNEESAIWRGKVIHEERE